MFAKNCDGDLSVVKKYDGLLRFSQTGCLLIIPTSRGQHSSLQSHSVSQSGKVSTTQLFFLESFALSNMGRLSPLKYQLEDSFSIILTRICKGTLSLSWSAHSSRCLPVNTRLPSMRWSHTSARPVFHSLLVMSSCPPSLCQIDG